jgi:hypothetical protein
VKPLILSTDYLQNGEPTLLEGMSRQQQRKSDRPLLSIHALINNSVGMLLLRCFVLRCAIA